MSMDSDEFIVLRKKAKTHDLREFLRRYEDIGCLAIQWRIFGTSGNVLRPRGGVLRNYYRCAGKSTHKDNYTIKTVVHVPSGSHHW